MSGIGKNMSKGEACLSGIASGKKNTVYGEAALPLFYLPCQWDQLLQKRICSFRSKFFTLRVDPILEGPCCIGKQTGSHRSCLS